MNKKHLIIFFVVLTMIISYINVNYIGKKINPSIAKYATVEAKRIATVVVNESVNNVVSKANIDEDILSLTKNREEEIQIIDFNTKNVNALLKRVSEEVQEKILRLEEGDSTDLPLGSSIRGDNFKNIRTGIVCEIKGGSLLGETLLSNTGPSIPIKLSFIGEVLTSIRTNVKSYGINNAYLEVNIEVQVTERITMPILTKNVTITKDIPIAMKVIQGKVPSYYNDSMEKLSQSYSLPLN